MKVTVVLNGGYKSCCTTYPLEFVLEYLRKQIEGEAEVQVIDKQKEEWTPDHVASMAIEYFGERAFPLVYAGDKLAFVGSLPDPETIVEIMNGEENTGITEADIVAAAKKYGVFQNGIEG
ncbi:MAG: hypothetical protein ACUVWJ_08760 [Spirochaetota bacterium]